MNPRHTRQTDLRYSRRDVMSPNRARRARRATIGVTVLLVAVLLLKLVAGQYLNAIQQPTSLGQSAHPLPLAWQPPQEDVPSE